MTATTKNHMPKFNAMQIEEIIDKVVPMIAKKEDHGVFRGILFCYADSCNNSSSKFTAFIEKLLKATRPDA